MLNNLAHLYLDDAEIQNDLALAHFVINRRQRNEMNRALGHLCADVRWHCPPDTGFEIRALAVRGRARYLSVTEAPHNTDFHRWMGKKHFCFFQTAETGNRTPYSGVKGNGANHYPRQRRQKEYIGFSFVFSSLKPDLDLPLTCRLPGMKWNRPYFPPILI